MSNISEERLNEILVAEGEGRVVILPSRNDEIVHAIKVALGIELYDWQKAYIFGNSDYTMPGRCTGHTTAYILKLILSEGEPIHLYKQDELISVSDGYRGIRYYRWFASVLEHLYYKLSNPELGLKLRKIYFTDPKKIRRFD